MRMFTVLALSLISLLGCAAPPGTVDDERLLLAEVVAGAVVTQPFGCTDLELEPYDPFCPHHHIHTGIDLAAPAGTAVHAAAGGVAHVRFDPAGAGLYLVVTDGAGTSILYGHLLAVHVGEGDVVTAGDVIGEVGSTGLATGAHLHLQVEVGGKLIDPAVWLASTPNSS